MNPCILELPNAFSNPFILGSPQIPDLTSCLQDEARERHAKPRYDLPLNPRARPLIFAAAKSPSERHSPTSGDVHERFSGPWNGPCRAVSGDFFA